MKRTKRWLGIMMAVILAAGSLQVPVYAAETGSTTAEAEMVGDTAENTEIAEEEGLEEELVGEDPSQEEDPAEDVVQEEYDDSSSEDTGTAEEVQEQTEENDQYEERDPELSDDDRNTDPGETEEDSEDSNESVPEPDIEELEEGAVIPEENPEEIIEVTSESTDTDVVYEGTEMPEDAEYWCGHYYYVFDESLTHAQAAAKCESMGGYLATATTSKEYSQIWSMISAKSKGKSAYQLSDIYKGSDGWYWDSGEELCYTNWALFDSKDGGNGYSSFTAGCLGWSDEALDSPNSGKYNGWNGRLYLEEGTTASSHHIAIGNGTITFSRYAIWGGRTSVSSRGSMFEYNDSDAAIGFVCEWGDPVKIEPEHVFLNGQTAGKESPVKYTFSGDSRQPSSISVYYDGVQLSLNQDYVTEIKGRSQIGTARVLVTGINRFQGLATKYYYVIPGIPNRPSVNEGTNYGNITITWDKVDGAKGYRIQYSTDRNFKDDVSEEDCTETEKTEYIVKNLKMGATYYFRIAAIGDLEYHDCVSDWSSITQATTESWIREFYPKIGETDIDYNSEGQLFYLIFENRIDFGNGYAYLYEEGNDKTHVELIHISENGDKCAIENDHCLTLTFSKDSLKRGKNYYISIDKAALRFVDDDYNDLNISFPGLDKNIWKFSTSDLEYFGFKNPTTETIDLKLYEKLFKPKKAEKLKNSGNDGSKGLCFGLGYVIGLKKIDAEKLKSCLNNAGKELGDFESVSDLKNYKVPGTSYTLLEYLELAFVYQDRSSMCRQSNNNKNKYSRLHDAIGGSPIVIGISTSADKKDGHDLYPIKIQEETNGYCDVLVYDSEKPLKSVQDCDGYTRTMPTFLHTLRLTKRNNTITGATYNGSNCTRITYRSVDTEFEDQISTASTPSTLDVMNLVCSFTMISNPSLIPINFSYGDNTETSSDDYLYWTEDSALDLNSEDNNTVSIIGDYDEIEVTANAGASISLDIENKTAKIENAEASAKDFAINYSHTEGEGNSKSVLIKGETSSTVNTESTESGIVVSYEDDTSIEANISASKNGEETASLDFSATTGKVNITYDDNETLMIWEDTDSDGTYETIVAKSVEKKIEDAEITGISNKQYTGSPIEQSLTVMYDGSELANGIDYTVEYENNTDVGTASMTFNGIGSYTGTITKTFMILPGKTTRGDMFNLANNVKVTWKEVPGAKYYKVYREGVTDPSESLDEPVIITDRPIGWDKMPGLTNGHAYRYKIVASLTGKDAEGKSDPSGDSPLSYSKLMYRLKTVVIRSVKNTAPGKVTVKYDRTTSGDSYVLQYCERQDMVGAKTKVVLGASKTSYVIGGLKKGRTYYISIRVRKKVNGIDYYTTFGVAKKIKIVK